MPSNEIVSVYIPTRNRVQLLEKAVESVLTQTYKNIELIVVDDASDDKTREFLERRAKQDSRLVYLINPQPRGAPASRNRAIRMSRGTFITGLDDDDEFLPERVGAFVRYWEFVTSFRCVPAFLYSQDGCRVDGTQSISKKRGSVESSDLYVHNEIGNQIFAPKSHYVDAGLFDESLPAWQDLELFMRISRRFGTGILLDMPTYILDRSPGIDRISARRDRILQAFKMVSSKETSATARQRQQLFLQVFNQSYGLRPDVSDWLHFLGLGVWPYGLLKLFRANVRGLARGKR